jgi:hypothetical protein
MSIFSSDKILYTYIKIMRLYDLSCACTFAKWNQYNVGRGDETYTSRNTVRNFINYICTSVIHKHPPTSFYTELVKRLSCRLLFDCEGGLVLLSTSSLDGVHPVELAYRLTLRVGTTFQLVACFEDHRISSALLTPIYMALHSYDCNSCHGVLRNIHKIGLQANPLAFRYAGIYLTNLSCMFRIIRCPIERHA